MTTDKTIEQMNRAISEFMGGKYCEYPNKIFPDEFGYQFEDFNPTHNSSEKSSWWNIKVLAFHSSWDWLMLVVEKLEEGFRIDIYNKACKISQPQWTVDIAHVHEKKIMAVHFAVYDAIIWLKNNTTTKQ